MEQELVDKLESTDMPGELKLALTELAHEVDLLWPSLSAVQRRRTRRRLDRVVVEATDPATDTHWWEVYLDLIAKMAGEGGTAGQPVVDAIGRLRPLLRARLGPYDEVSLQPITEDTVWGICQLSDTLTEPRKNFVATNAVSLAQAHFNKHAWFRAIYAGKAPVGFMMIVDNDETPEYFLWRFMIAEPYQGRGYGRQAIQRLVEYVRTRPGARGAPGELRRRRGKPQGVLSETGVRAHR